MVNILLACQWYIDYYEYDKYYEYNSYCTLQWFLGMSGWKKGLCKKKRVCSEKFGVATLNRPPPAVVATEYDRSIIPGFMEHQALCFTNRGKTHIHFVL